MHVVPINQSTIFFLHQLTLNNLRTYLLEHRKARRKEEHPDRPPRTMPETNKFTKPSNPTRETMRRRVVFTLLQYTTGGASRGLQHVMLLAMAVPDGTGSGAAVVLDRGGVAALDEVEAVRDGARVEGV